MMKHFKTRAQIAEQIGISRSTLERKLKKANLQLPKGLVSPENQVKIYHLLGCKVEKSNSLMQNDAK